MRRRSLRRVTKVVVVWTVVFAFFSWDTANACHRMFRWSRGYYGSAPAYCGPPVYYYQSPSACYPVSPCRVVVTCSPQVKVTPPKSTAPSRPMPAERAPALTDGQRPTTPAEPLRPATGTEGLVPPPEQPPSRAVQPTEPDVEQSPNDIDRLFEEDSTQTPPTSPTPATETPAGEVDDLFPDTTEQPDGSTAPQPAPPAEQPASDNLDDLFGPSQGGQTEGAAADGQPRSQVQPAADENVDDVFGGTSSQGAEAAEDVTDEPSTTNDTGDLFAPSAVEDTQVQPAAAQEEASSDTEDLFADPGPGNSNPSGAPPADTAPEEMDADELFNDSSSQTEQPAPNADNAEPLGEQPVGTTTADHSMIPRAATPEAAADSSVQPEEPAAKLAAQNIGQPVRTMAVPIADVDGTVNAQLGTRQVDGGPLPIRRWTDNTGIYHTTAQLVEVGDASVRLWKDTGRFTTVPLRRLSPADLRYVHQHAATSLDQAAHVALR